DAGCVLFPFGSYQNCPMEGGILKRMRLRHSFLALLPILIAAAMPAAEIDSKAIVLKHLKTSRDFTLKVAGQMPESSFDFKLTPPQMSFAEQMVHLSQGFDYFLAGMLGRQPNPAKPASMNKADVLAFMTKSFDEAIGVVSKLTPDQMAKTYKSDE